MITFSGAPAGPNGHAPHVRAAHRILGRAHASVAGLFGAVDVLDESRRTANSTTKGRMSKVELDVLRSAIVLTSAGLDAAMKRLVNDVGGTLAALPDTAARRQFEEWLKAEMAKPNITEPFRQAVLSKDVAERLLSAYLAERTKASFQGSGDLKKRVRQTLGIPSTAVTDSALESLDDFFVARNRISHAMDLIDPSSDSIARHPRNPTEVARQCSEVFDVAGALIRAAAKIDR